MIFPHLLEGYILLTSMAQSYEQHRMRIAQVLFISLLDQKHSYKRCPEPEVRTSLLTEYSMCQPGHPLTHQVISTSGTKNSREDTSSVSFLFNGKLELYLTSEVITHCINNCEGRYADHRWPVGNSRHRQNGPGAI